MRIRPKSGLVGAIGSAVSGSATPQRGHGRVPRGCSSPQRPHGSRLRRSAVGGASRLSSASCAAATEPGSGCGSLGGRWVGNGERCGSQSGAASGAEEPNRAEGSRWLAVASGRAAAIAADSRQLTVAAPGSMHPLGARHLRHWAAATWVGLPHCGQRANAGRIGPASSGSGAPQWLHGCLAVITPLPQLTQRRRARVGIGSAQPQ